MADMAFHSEAIERLFSLFKPFLLVIMLDKIMFCYLSIKILMDIKKRSYYTIHKLCFLTFKSIIRMSAFFAFMFLSIPSSTLWYFQLILSLSNDISENPGPQCTNNTWGWGWGGGGGTTLFLFM